MYSPLPRSKTLKNEWKDTVQFLSLSRLLQSECTKQWPTCQNESQHYCQLNSRFSFFSLSVWSSFFFHAFWFCSAGIQPQPCYTSADVCHSLVSSALQGFSVSPGRSHLSRRFSSPPLSLSSLSSVNMEGTAKQCWGWKQDLEGLSESNHFATRVAILSVSYHIWSAYTAATKHRGLVGLTRCFS